MSILLEAMVPFIEKITAHIPVWATVPFFLINIYATFVWNYIDIFIMMISMGLSELFKQLNSELEQAKDEVEIKFPTRRQKFQKQIFKMFLTFRN